MTQTRADAIHENEYGTVLRCVSTKKRCFIINVEIVSITAASAYDGLMYGILCGYAVTMFCHIW